MGFRDSHHYCVGLAMFKNSFCELVMKIDEGRIVDAVYMDFSKAFNKVPQGRPMIHGDLVEWIQNWLGHERPRVVVEGRLPDWMSLISNVSQR